MIRLTLVQACGTLAMAAALTATAAAQALPPDLAAPPVSDPLASPVMPPAPFRTPVEGPGPKRVPGTAPPPLPTPQPSPTPSPVPSPVPGGQRRIVPIDRQWSEIVGKTDLSSAVTIPEGKTVEINVCDIEVATLTIRGTLRVSELSAAHCPHIHLKASTVVVTGPEARFEVGTESVPFTGRFQLTLHGDPVAGPRLGMAEPKMLMVMNGGTLDLHGASAAKRSWTQIDATALPGAMNLTLAEDAGWEVGDELVIASTNLDPREAERLRIAGVSADGRTVTLAHPLDHPHFGRKLAYGGKVIDQRAEVGLLTHNIVIEGDKASPRERMGGTIMVMNADMDRPGDEGTRPAYTGPVSKAFIEGVELRRMGQTGRAGRYAFHWHLVDDGSGQYVRNSSVHGGFQRAVNVHGTDDVSVEGVVAYDISNHMFVPSEEGDEVRNRFVGNLGILSKTVSREDFAFPSLTGNGRSNQSEQRSSVFWMRNTFNTLHGNVAAGAFNGQGYFLDPAGHAGLHKKLAYAASGDPELCDFVGNRAHSIFVNIGSPDLYTPAVKGVGLFKSTRGLPLNKDKTEWSTCTFRGFQAYKTQNGAVWIENNTVLEDAIITDSHTGVMAGDVVRDVVVVGQTENDLASGNVPLPTSSGVDYITPHPKLSRGGFMQSNNGGQSIRGREFSDLTCIGLPACFNNMVNKTGEIGWYEGAVIEDVTVSATEMGFVVGRTKDDSGPNVRFSSGKTPTFGRVRDADGDLSGTPGRLLPMSDPRFQTRTREQATQFGWSWESLPKVPSDPL